jgi:hypothetical protein
MTKQYATEAKRSGFSMPASITVSTHLRREERSRHAINRAVKE